MKIFRGSEQHLLPDLNLSAKKKKQLYNVCLLSERQGIIAFTLYIDPIYNNLISIYIASESALINIIAGAQPRRLSTPRMFSFRFLSTFSQAKIFIYLP